MRAFDERFRSYRLSFPEAEPATVGSRKRYGQMAPVVVWACDGDLVLIDAFRRLSASRSINGCDTLLMRVLGCDTGSATADLHNLNPVGRGAKEIKEAWIEQALIREDGLIQVDVSELLGHHRSWVSQRPALLERLCNAA